MYIITLPGILQLCPLWTQISLLFDLLKFIVCASRQDDFLCFLCLETDSYRAYEPQYVDPIFRFRELLQ